MPKTSRYTPNSGQSLAGAVLSEWHATIGYLSSCTPKTLDLCMVCDVDPKDIEIAKHVVDPLGRLPLLKNCHLRLRRISTATLNDLSSSTISQVCGISDTRASMLPQLGTTFLVLQVSAPQQPLGPDSWPSHKSCAFVPLNTQI